jgi:hypothetical protein
MPIISGSVVGYREVTNPLQDLIDGLTTDGVWAKLDRLWIYAQLTEGVALVDLVVSDVATAVNSPTFTANKGYTGEDVASPTKYINTNYNPVTDAINYSLNDAHMSAWSVTNVAAVNGGCWLGLTDGGASITELTVTFTDGNIYSRINASAINAGTTTARAGHWISTRDSSTTDQLYKNGSLFASPNATSNSVTNLDFFALARNQAGSPLIGTPNQLAMVSMGGALDSTLATAFYNRLRTYMTAVGVVNPLQQLINGLIEDGIFELLDRLWVFAQPTEAEELVDLVAGATATAVNSPTFIANQGYAGDGATSYIDSLFNPITAGGNYLQDSATAGAYVRNNRTTPDNTTVLGLAGAGDILLSPLGNNFGGSDFIYEVNSTTAVGSHPAETSTRASWLMTRTGAAASAAYKNGTSLDTDTASSGAITSANIFIFAFNNGGTPQRFSSDQVAAVYFGAGFNDIQAANLMARLNTYMTAIGANVY